MSRKVINGALLDVATAAEWLGCSQRSLRARVARGLVPARWLNNRVVFVRRELEQFVEDLPGVSLDEARDNARRRRKLNDKDEAEVRN